MNWLKHRLLFGFIIILTIYYIFILSVIIIFKVFESNIWVGVDP